VLRKTLSVTVVLAVLWAAQSAANPIAITPGGAIDLYGNNSGTAELVYDSTPGLVVIYVVHTFEPLGGAAACQFSAPKPACFAGTYLSDTSVFPVTIGNSQSGVSVGYGSCRQYPIHVLTIAFFGLGTTSCCYYPVLPDPNEPSGQVVAVDCGQQLVPVTAGATVVNFVYGCYSIPVEETSWGKVKSLYVD
jgi:hypothetical protein